VLTIAPQAAVLEFRIDPGIERAPLTVVFRGDDVHIVRTTLSSREAEHVIRDLLLSLQPGHLRLDAGALGAVEFQVIIAASTAQAPLEQRTVFWLACAATDRERGTAPLVSPTVIRQIATDAPLLAAAMRCPGSAAATQLRALARHRRP
jgi:hypothetical protein